MLQAYGTYGGKGPMLALPQNIDLGRDPSGNPDMRLALVRGASQSTEAENYANLQLRLCADYNLNEAVTQGSVSNGSLAPAPIRGGVLVLRPALALDVPDELLAPIPLDWNALGASHISLKLSAAAGALLRQAITGGVVMFGAVAELEIAGVAQPLNCLASLDCAQLYAKLRNLADHNGRIARDDLVAMLENDLQTLPIELSGDVGNIDKKSLANALADQVRLN